MSSAEKAFTQLIDVMKQLRTPETGCPWDVEQDFDTIAPYTIEEAYEVADAIQRRDMTDLKEELGDLLFQVVFHSQMAKERGHFDIGDVVTAITDKMYARHPHVFGQADGRSSHDQVGAWEEMKAAERAEKANASHPNSALDGVATALPALMRAEKLQKRAARIGFDWTEAEQIFAKLEEETAEVREAMNAADPDAIEDEIGDLLFVVANLARRLEVDPEVALRRANGKFERRFRAMEIDAARAGQVFATLDIEGQEAWWQAVKQKEEES